MKVILYHVGRNLNRCYRTCYAFGISEILFVGNLHNRSIQWELKGHLFRAKNKVQITPVQELPDLSRTLAMEDYYSMPLQKIRWEGIDSLLIGNETRGLPRKIASYQKARIPTTNGICLTVEATLAIALYEWQRSTGKIV